MDKVDREKIENFWTVCTRCQIEYSEPGQEMCTLCHYDLEAVEETGVEEEWWTEERKELGDGHL